jgi:hypothetical protein
MYCPTDRYSAVLGGIEYSLYVFEVDYSAVGARTACTVSPRDATGRA